PPEQVYPAEQSQREREEKEPPGGGAINRKSTVSRRRIALRAGKGQRPARAQERFARPRARARSVCPRPGARQAQALPARFAIPRAMPHRALRQGDLFEALHDPSALWAERLHAALADPQDDANLLPLVEKALRACPTALPVQVLAATAALVAGRPQWTLALAEEAARAGPSATTHLLRALALHALNRRAVAKALLERHGLTRWH